MSFSKAEFILLLEKNSVAVVNINGCSEYTLQKKVKIGFRKCGYQLINFHFNVNINLEITWACYNCKVSQFLFDKHIFLQVICIK